jgi:formylglycine-generating enzyme required for sulfatase activity
MGYNNSANQGCDNCPVENVSWNDVTSFISKINKMSNNRFRLPTEAEWEYVARRAIRNEIENPGNKRAKQIETLLQQNVWYNENSEGKTHPVGKRNHCQRFMIF